jgi:hypothetical protein
MQTNSPLHPPIRLARRWTRALVAILVVVVSIIVVFLNVVGAHFRCFDEDAYCAQGGPPVDWIGRVYAPTGAPAAHANVRFWFYSTRGGPTVVTDNEGRYCVRRLAELAGYVSATTSSTNGPPDPRYAELAHRRKGGGVIIVTPPNDRYRTIWNGYGGDTTNTGWDAATDTTTHCESASVPWNRSTDLRSNWHYRLLIWAPLLAAVLALLGLIPRTDSRLTEASLALLLAIACLWLISWT